MIWSVTPPILAASLRAAPSWIAARVRSLRACGPSFEPLARARKRSALKSSRNRAAAAMANLLRFANTNQTFADSRIGP
jgi:hypothetical protein